jgi:hypothetical protein
MFLPIWNILYFFKIRTNEKTIKDEKKCIMCIKKFDKEKNKTINVYV